MARRKRRYDPWDDDIFRELKREMDLMLRALSEAFEQAGLPVVHGVRITIGPDMVPRIEEFGNVRRNGERLEVLEYREPLVDVMEHGNSVIVTAELPGAEKEKIRVFVRGNVLDLDASGAFRYRKRVYLPKRVDPTRARATFKNGILEIELPISDEARPAPVKVE